MISIEENKSLKSFNTFGVDVQARYFCGITQIDQFTELIQSSLYKSKKHLILGGGSNILFTKDFDGLVIKTELKGIVKIAETPETVTIKVSSGENWHELVLHAVDHGWGGIENLSLIPGTVGAAPMQNIGAYGVEVQNVVKEVETVDLATGSVRVFTREECRFGYRESVFKGDLKEKYFISSVTLSLTKKNHQLNITYGAIQDTLKASGVSNVSIRDVSNAVIQIRRSKLPDPAEVGNAGSFFKNPTVTTEQYVSWKKSYPNIPGYQIDNQHVKVPAGWLIEQCDWKGKRLKNVGIHPLQALVIVNYGSASGEEILSLARKIQDDVKEKFDVELIPEVNIL